LGKNTVHPSRGGGKRGGVDEKKGLKYTTKKRGKKYEAQRKQS